MLDQGWVIEYVSAGLDQGWVIEYVSSGLDQGWVIEYVSSGLDQCVQRLSLPVFSIVTGEPFKQSAELTEEPIKMKALNERLSLRLWQATARRPVGRPVADRTSGGYSTMHSATGRERRAALRLARLEPGLGFWVAKQRWLWRQNRCAPIGCWGLGLWVGG